MVFFLRPLALNCKFSKRIGRHLDPHIHFISQIQKKKLQKVVVAMGETGVSGCLSFPQKALHTYLDGDLI